MAPTPSAPQQPAASSDAETTALPPLVRSSTVPTSLQSHRADPSHLAPEDAFHSPPRRPPVYENASGNELRPGRLRRKNGSRSRSRRRKRFQKLLWVKQSYPDNYTDQATFLENLQRNPRLQPYDFWPLIADSTIIVQHVCSVIIFVVCFVGIFQERVSPVSVVGWGSAATFLGWLLWDWWVGQADEDGVVDGALLARTRSVGAGRNHRDYRPSRRQDAAGAGHSNAMSNNASFSSVSNLASAASSTSNLTPTSGLAQESPHSPRRRSATPGPSNSSHNLLPSRHAHSTSMSSLHSATSQMSHSPARGGSQGAADAGSAGLRHPASATLGSSRTQLRMSTIKSAVLIYFTLLALSPILKSLTRSTSSDSIWSMSFWLLTINIFFFDYSGAWAGVNKFPVASLSTNAALMASTVLASRLPSTGQVFSLTMFSIEVFGLFPVFRRYARHKSWRYHVVLTALLVLGAGGGVGMILSGDENGLPWQGGLLGMIVGCLIAALAMGGCSWWLIGLQKYKNEIYGPWDPARPIIISRRHWDDE